ncbi:MAG: aldehyde dehydrogenase family protein [Candidatus Eiseniibacteriota bacterium]
MAAETTTQNPPQVRPGKLWIGGEYQDAANGQTFEVINPALGEPFTTCAAAGREDVDRAVRVATEAFRSPAWAGMSALDRQRILWNIGERLLARADEIATAETLCNGKPIFESRYIDTPDAAKCFQYFAGWATKLAGEVLPISTGPFLNYTRKEPLGVIGAIVAWNFPLLLASWKVAPALAAGNTVVLKPAEFTPLSALLLAECAKEAGLPDGVLNVLPGKGSVAGQALVEHPGVAKIAFTGSTEVGKGILRTSAETVKKVQMELGGKSPNIIFADADLEAAVRGAANGIFYGKGEICAAGSRLLVERSIYDTVVAKLKERAEKTPPADPMHPKTRLGALVRQGQMEKVLGYIDTGRKEGAKLVAGGERAPVNGKGYFVQATVFADVKNDMTIAREEIFGPVLAVLPFDGEDEAIRIANDTEFGLAAGVWTRDLKRGHRVAHRLEAGTVWVNAYNRYDTATPFGGYKQSGFGRDMGPEALEGYVQTKSVWIDLSEDKA